LYFCFINGVVKDGHVHGTGCGRFFFGLLGELVAALSGEEPLGGFDVAELLHERHAGEKDGVGFEQVFLLRKFRVVALIVIEGFHTKARKKTGFFVCSSKGKDVLQFIDNFRSHDRRPAGIGYLPGRVYRD
jgi:hypothetical protein